MEVRRKHLILAVLVAASILVGWEEFRPRERITPAGEPPLVELRSAGPVRAAFNTAKDEVRIVVLLSPT